jgi:hypothetical protein
MPKCAPEWPLREDPAHKDYLELALQILRERHRHESAAAILRAYSRPEEGLKLSTLKLFLRADHKGPVRGLTRHALIRAGQRAWGRHCPLAQLYDQLAVMLLGPSGRNAIEPFYGRHRWLDRRKGERHEVSNAAAVMGPCAKCGRPLFQIKPRNVVRCGFAFNVSTRLYIFAVERNYMRMAVLRSPDVPGADPLVGILLAEEKDPAAQVVAAKAALVPEASPWYGRGDLQERVSKVLVNEMDLGLPDGTLTGWKSLPPLPE